MCLMFSSSRPCCYFEFVLSSTRVVVSVMLYSCIVCVALCLTVFMNCFLKQFAICLGVVAILLFNVMEVYSVCGGALLGKPCMVFQRMCL